MALETLPLTPEDDPGFFDERFAVPAAELVARIRRMTSASSAEVWDRYISSDGRHPMLLPLHAWPRRIMVGGRKYAWHEDWNRKQPERVRRILRSELSWRNDADVYFFRAREEGYATRWAVFADMWMSFLFDDEGPVLFSPESDRAVVFTPDGELAIGSRIGLA